MRLAGNVLDLLGTVLPNGWTARPATPTARTGR